MSKFIDETGNVYGRLTVISQGDYLCGKRKKVAWNCICECGNKSLVSGDNLRQGSIKSCGCLQGSHFIKHNKSNTSLHTSWKNIIQRCTNKNLPSYKNYGGRGITICDEWLDNFQAFYDYISKLPYYGIKDYTLDRINNDGNYEPNNIRWSTRTVQNTNQRIRINNTSGTKGVTFYKRSNKWRAFICINKTHIHLGYYDNKLDAINARKDAELRYLDYVTI